MAFGGRNLFSAKKTDDDPELADRAAGTQGEVGWSIRLSCANSVGRGGSLIKSSECRMLCGYDCGGKKMSMMLKRPES
jgi:hypothetical protein